MKFQVLSLLLALAAAQEQAQTLEEVLAANSDSLSALAGLLETQPEIVEALSSQTNITILAPNNDAIQALLATEGIAEAVAADPSIVAAILQYHVFPGTYRAEDIPETPAFVPSLLTNETYTSLSDGQVVEAVAADGGVTFYSALKAESSVVLADVEFTGGVIHVIDAVLTIPQNVVDTATAANLTALTGAVVQADLADALLEAEQVTIFAPNDEAFAALGEEALAELSSEDLQSILQYHVVAGTVAYSSSLEEGEVETLNGDSVEISLRDGKVYVNDAEVILADVLIANGVVHVIDSVLTPGASPSASSSAPAQPSASGDAEEASAVRTGATLAIGAVVGAAAIMMNF